MTKKQNKKDKKERNKMSVFNSDNRADHTKALAFLDPSGGVAIQRYDMLKYKQFDKLTDKQLSLIHI